MKKYVMGKKIGEGQSRIVYENNLDKKTVVKIPKKLNTSLINENYLEYLNYTNFRRLGLDNFLCPCVYHNGFLIMKKTSPMPKNQTYFIPRLLSSCSVNWGILDGKPVCIDYDFLTLPSSPIFSKKEEKIQSIFFNLYLFSNNFYYLKKKIHHSKHSASINYTIIKNKWQLNKLLTKKVYLQ